MIIGIDPDVSKSGVAVAVKGKLESLSVMTFVELCNFLSIQPPGTQVCIENVEHDMAVYYRKGNNNRQMLTVAQNVGMVKATMRHIVAVAESFNLKVELVKPLGKTSELARRAKADAGFFNQVTGWKGRTNPDMRDAGMIALVCSK